MPTPLEKDIFKPLAYFSYFGFPLTVFEIWKWQYEPEGTYSLEEICSTLESSSWLRERASSFNGHYALGSSGEVREQFEERHRRYLDAIKKERKLKRYLPYLASLPGVRGVAMCNSLPFRFTREGGDIDVFVISKAGQVWSTRFFAVAPLIPTKQRPGDGRQNPIDLSFFVSEKMMNLSLLKHAEKDPYMAYWVKTLTPIHGSEALWDRFFVANAWADALIPNAARAREPYAFRSRSRWRLPNVRMPERSLKRLSKNRLPKDLRDMANKDTRVIISDYWLKFHRTDRRDEIAHAFEDLCAKNF